MEGECRSMERLESGLIGEEAAKHFDRLMSARYELHKRRHSATHVK